MTQTSPSPKSTHPLSEQLKALEQIQELDLKIDQLKKSKGALPETLRSMDVAASKLQTNMTAKNQALLEIDKVARQTKAAQDLNRDRMGRSETRMVSVQNSQEYQAANKEVEQAKKLAITLDEQSKKSETDANTLKKDIADLTTQHDKIKAERDAQASVLAGQNSKLDGEITTLTAERASFTSRVDRPLLSQYDRVRGARQGVGFTSAIAGRCKGCNMMVPPQLYNEIRKLNAIHACPSCHRILYVPADSPA